MRIAQHRPSALSVPRLVSSTHIQLIEGVVRGIYIIAAIHICVSMRSVRLLLDLAFGENIGPSPFTSWCLDGTFRIESGIFGITRRGICGKRIWWIGKILWEGFLSWSSRSVARSVVIFEVIN
jgi:hypothetical protein